MRLVVMIVVVLVVLASASAAPSATVEDPSCSGLALVSRDDWGSSKPNKAVDLTSTVNLTFVHHTAGSECDDPTSCSLVMRGIQKFHIEDRGWDDIGYSFLVGGDCRVYVGRDWGRVGAHTYMYNSVAYGISLMGNFMEKLPSQCMMDATKQLIKCGISKGLIDADYGLYGHRDGRCTECPGDKFYAEQLPSWNRWHAKGPIKKWC